MCPPTTKNYPAPNARGVRLGNLDLQIWRVTQKELIGTCYTPSSGLDALPVLSRLIFKGKTTEEVLALLSPFSR